MGKVQVAMSSGSLLYPPFLHSVEIGWTSAYRASGRTDLNYKGCYAFVTEQRHYLMYSAVFPARTVIPAFAQPVLQLETANVLVFFIVNIPNW